MKSLKIAVMLMLAASFLVGCKKKEKVNAMDHSAVAKEMCACAGDLLDNMDKVSKLSASEAPDVEALKTLQSEIESKSKAMEKCIIGLETKYPTLKEEGDDTKKVAAEATKSCPKLTKLLSE